MGFDFEFGGLMDDGRRFPLMKVGGESGGKFRAKVQRSVLAW